MSNATLTLEFPRPISGSGLSVGDTVVDLSGFEQQLWKAANRLRGSMETSQYKHIVLGLIFLKYISDVFDDQYDDVSCVTGADPEDPDEYRNRNAFWAPPVARWRYIERQVAGHVSIGPYLNEAMHAIERENPAFENMLPKDYVRPDLRPELLGQLVKLIGSLRMNSQKTGSIDFLGRVYEYFLREFASAEGRKGGEFYTPHCIVKLLVEMLSPYEGIVYDPCCGSGGMFVQSMEFIRAHRQRSRSNRDISIFGQESNYTTWGLANMNLAIRGVEGQIAYGDTLRQPFHSDLRADFILANPPFNVSSWSGQQLRNDPRWRYGVPPPGNANFAWVQHIIHHMAPDGTAGIVLANGSMSSTHIAESSIRKNIVEAGLVHCMVALPGQLFYSTPIPVCLWILSQRKNNGRNPGTGEVLFIDARDMSAAVDRTHRELTDHEIEAITNTYHAWKGDAVGSEYSDVSGFCRSVNISEIRRSRFDLNPGRYVGSTTVQNATGGLAKTLGRSVAEANIATERVLDYAENFRVVADEAQTRLQEAAESILRSGRPGVVGDIASVFRHLIDPQSRIGTCFDLYSIPAFDAARLPEPTSGDAILSAKQAVPSKAILVSRLNPRKPRIWPVENASKNAICSTEFVILQPEEDACFEYLNLYCHSKAFHEYLVAHATGSTGSRQRVRVTDILAAPVMIPTCEDMKRLEFVLKPIRVWLQTMPAQMKALSNLMAHASDFTVSEIHANSAITQSNP